MAEGILSVNDPETRSTVHDPWWAVVSCGGKIVSVGSVWVSFAVTRTPDLKLSSFLLCYVARASYSVFLSFGFLNLCGEGREGQNNCARELLWGLHAGTWGHTPRAWNVAFLIFIQLDRLPRPKSNEKKTHHNPRSSWICVSLFLLCSLLC